jgi:hypothetical protein
MMSKNSFSTQIHQEIKEEFNNEEDSIYACHFAKYSNAACAITEGDRVYVIAKSKG